MVIISRECLPLIIGFISLVIAVLAIALYYATIFFKKETDYLGFSKEERLKIESQFLDIPKEYINFQISKSDWISCECPELCTWHPGQVKHKLECAKFWRLNPGKTKDDLLRYEGF